jgi:hypothetical protein
MFSQNREIFENIDLEEENFVNTSQGVLFTTESQKKQEIDSSPLELFGESEALPTL